MAKKRTGAHGAKSAFVKSQPHSMPAKEVVAKAKEAGIVLNEKYVYNVRSTSGTAKRAGPGRPGRPPKAAGGMGGGRTAEDILQAVAAEIGLSRAIALLQQRQQVVRSVLGR